MAVLSGLAAMQAADWDLAIQLHGSGQLSNPLVAMFGARFSAGFHAPGAWVPPADASLYCPWPEEGYEAHRLLALCDHLGLPHDGEALEFPLRPEDDAALDRVWPGWRRGGYACLHAGSQLPSRRWPVARFAAVAEGLHERRLLPVLTGTAGEAPLVGQLASLLTLRGIPHVNLAGRTCLWSLGALLRGARLLVCNDTGVSHIAAALRVPSLVVSCGSEVARWAPPDRQLHRVLAAAAPCRPCAHAICPVGHGCALDLRVDAVLQELSTLLESQLRRLHAPPPAHPDLACPWQLPLQPDAGAA
jgi:ADP-heptose:LPS heptosyltransferase